MTNTITPVFLSSQAYAVKHRLQPANPNSLCSSQTRNFSSPIKMFSLSEFQINSTSIRNPRLMSPAVVASRSDYHNKLVPIDRVLHALHGKSCRLGRIDRNHHRGGWVILISKVKTQWKVGKKVQSKCRRNKKCVAVLAAQFKRRVVG